MCDKHKIEFYKADSGNRPFEDWMDKIKDKMMKAKILIRIDRIKKGNFGDWSSIKGTNGLMFELREHKSPAYRIYYIKQNNKIIILTGSNKRDQKKIIEKAKEYLNDYEI